MNEQQIAVARVYARSMFELAERRQESRSLLEELEGMVAVLDAEPQVDAFLTNPLVDTEARRRALETMLRGRASDLLVDSLQVANAKGRMSILRTMVEVYREELRDHEGLVEVKVTSAVPLDEALRQRLVAAASRFTGREALLEESVDPELIAGMVVRVGDRKVDSSVTSELRKMHDKLLDRASREIHASGAFVEEG